MLETKAKTTRVTRVSTTRRRVRRLSEYGEKLREKQKVKQAYKLREAALRVSLARFQRRQKSLGKTEGSSFLAFLERRLDNALYRLGAVPSRRAARQLIAHGRVKVGGRRVLVPSFWLRAGDELEIKGANYSEEVVVPAWLKLEKKKGKAVVVRLPDGSEVEPDIDEKLVFDYYSRW